MDIQRVDKGIQCNLIKKPMDRFSHIGDLSKKVLSLSSSRSGIFKSFGGSAESARELKHLKSILHKKDAAILKKDTKIKALKKIIRDLVSMG